MSNIANLFRDPATNKWTAMYAGKILASSPSKDYVVNNIKKGNCTKARAAGVVDVMENGVQIDSPHAPIPTVEERFSINDRFDFLEDFVNMVASGVSPSLLVTGEGGLGKTHTILASLKAAGLKDSHDVLSSMEIEEDEDGEPLSETDLLESSGIPASKLFSVVKGYSTAKGLYRTLYENRNRLTIFDDCDSILKDGTALNILKGALDSYDRRIISWNAENPNDDLPRSFEFKGRVIFISNKPIFSIDQAVRSRAICVDLSMNTTQKIERMRAIIEGEHFLPEYDIKTKRAALEVLDEMKNQAKELNFRTLIAVTRVAGIGGKNWKRRAEYLLTAI